MMNHSTQLHGDSSAAPSIRVGRCVAGFLLACLPLASLSSPAVATDSETMPMGLGGQAAALLSAGPVINFAPTVWGDDTIGALPIVGEDNGSFSSVSIPLLNAIMLNSAPSLVLEGSLTDLQRTIKDVQGDAGSYVYLEPTMPGSARLFFHGAVTVQLERSLFHTGRIDVAMLTGARSPRNYVDFRQDGKELYGFGGVGGVVTDLHLVRLERSGLLDGSPLEAAVYFSRFAAPSKFDFQASPSRVILNQY